MIIRSLSFDHLYAKTRALVTYYYYCYYNIILSAVARAFTSEIIFSHGCRPRHKLLLLSLFKSLSRAYHNVHVFVKFYCCSVPTRCYIIIVVRPPMTCVSVHTATDNEVDFNFSLDRTISVLTHVLRVPKTVHGRQNIASL